jgi:hypothetical protein
MRVLSLIIKEVHLLNILNGTKKIETREVRPPSYEKYYEYAANGDLIGLRPYDAIQFYAGYRTDRKGALVEVLSSEMVAFTDEDTGEYITYKHGGEDHVEVNAEYRVGKVISTTNC